jgi:hypothetical protein
VKIVDEKGEMLVKGPQIVIGYYGNERATEEAFDKEGFLRTSDEICEGQGRQATHDKSYLTLPPHYTTHCAKCLTSSTTCHHLP